jgi:hypothetical protein
MFGKFSSASIPDAYLPSYFYDSLGKWDFFERD